MEGSTWLPDAACSPESPEVWSRLLPGEAAAAKSTGEEAGRVECGLWSDELKTEESSGNYAWGQTGIFTYTLNINGQNTRHLWPSTRAEQS
jgi:hypothetical protein